MSNLDVTQHGCDRSSELGAVSDQGGWRNSVNMASQEEVSQIFKKQDNSAQSVMDRGQMVFSNVFAPERNHDDERGEQSGQQRVYERGNNHQHHHHLHQDAENALPAPSVDNTTSTPPADNTAPPADNTAPTADNTAPPADNTAPPADNTAPPADNTAPPADNTAPPAVNTTPPADNTTPPASPGEGFTIQNGQLTVNGKLLAGVAVTGQYAQQVGPEALADEISSKFPGINVVRLATSPEGGAFTRGETIQGGETIDNINQTIKALNAKNIGVIVDNHGSDANEQNNVSKNGAEAAWFGQIAADNKNNNMVMFQPENEPTGNNADIVAEQKAAYDAIRATGSSAVVAFDLAGGGWAGPQQSDPGTYNQFNNYVIDAHAYASTNTDPASALRDEVAQTSGLREANGTAVPVFIGETGNSIDGSTIDGAAGAMLNADMTQGNGAVFWLYDGAATGFGNGNGADHLTDSNGNLSSFGQDVASLIQRGAS